MRCDDARKSLLKGVAQLDRLAEAMVDPEPDWVPIINGLKHFREHLAPQFLFPKEDVGSVIDSAEHVQESSLEEQEHEKFRLLRSLFSLREAVVERAFDIVVECECAELRPGA